MDQDLESIQEARRLVEKAAQAQKVLENFTQEQIDAVVRACAEAARQNAEALARLAVEETTYGVVADKIEKNLFASRDVYNAIKDMKTVGVLREEGHGAKRSLVCSLCLTEWDYRRVVCPACGEERFDKLSAYTASQFEHMRVEACDTCKVYINTVDLTKNGLAIPVVDELAALPLGLWAQEKGYTKLQSNLLGI